MNNPFTPRLDRFRFYLDGSESGSTPIAAENTNISRLVTSNAIFHLRVLIQETGNGTSGATTDDWQLQYNKNSTGWNDVTTSSNNVRGYDSASLTDAGTTTNRATNGITDGSGSFVTGEIAENGLITDRQLTLSNFSEYLYSLQLIAADLAAGDVIQFRVLYNGATFTHNVTPQITAVKLLETLTDDYDDNSISSVKWSTFGTGVAETNQQLELTQPSSSATYRGLTSVGRFDMTGSYAYQRVINAGNQALSSLEVWPVQVQKDGSNGVMWLITGNTIHAYKRVGGSASSIFNTTYSATTHKYFRIRESGGTIYWDTSDGLTWTNRATATVASLFDVSVVYIEVAVGTWQSEASGTTVILDNFSVGPLTTQVSVTKQLKYTVKVTPSALTKSLKYTIGKPLSITKSAKYTVIKSLSITKQLKYTVRTSPSGITKSLRYAIKKVIAITKSARYAIIKSISATKQLKYTIYKNVAITKSSQYAVRKSNSITKQLKYTLWPVTYAVTKSSKYTIIKQQSITKQLRYAVLKVASAITKSTQYAIKKAIGITKSLQYVVIKPIAITKTSQYAVIKSNAIQKSLSYNLTGQSVNIQKSAKYTVITSVAIIKQLKYAVATTPTAITKSSRYAVVKNIAITKQLKYVVATNQAITKSAQYAVITQQSITKQLRYVIKQTPFAITKSARYAVKTTQLLSKSMQYAVFKGQNVVKTARYAVKTVNTIAKQIIYHIRGNFAITKGLEYRVLMTTAITKELRYAVMPVFAITKQVKYTVITEQVITKQLQYEVITVLPDTYAIQKSLTYVVVGELYQSTKLITANTGNFAETSNYQKSEKYITKQPFINANN